MLFYLLLSTLSEFQQDFITDIFEKYKNKIYNIAYSILRNEHDSEDAVDMTMVKIIENVEKFLHKSRPEIDSQIVIYSRSVSIDIYRKNKKRLENESSLIIDYNSETEENQEIDIEDESPGIFDIILSKETADILEQALKELPDIYADAIKLKYMFEYEISEISKILNVTNETVYKRITRAKIKLLKIAGETLHDRIQV